MANSNWVTVGWRSESEPEDADKEDKAEIREMTEALMQAKYPPFTPEIVSTLSKDYYLPALKVLEMDKNGKFFSPSQTGEWIHNELVAECQASGGYGHWTIRISYPFGTEEVTPVGKHKAPHEDCDCGIYGSVHMEEVRGYLEKDTQINASTMAFSSWRSSPPQILEEKKRVLCIIEPSEGAEVIVCRKGWKASKAFISEIVGETISIAEASQLLSMAWQRNIDVRRVFHEDR